MSVVEYHISYYVIILTFCLFGVLLKQFKNDKWGNFPFCALLIVSIALLIGNRAVSIGTDTELYLGWFKQYVKASGTNLKEYFSFGGDPLFKYVCHFFGKVGSFRDFLVLVSLTISTLNYFFARQAVKLIGHGSISMLFIMMMTSSITWNEQINIIRSGIAMGFFLLFLIYLFKNKKKLCVLFALLALGNHFSTLFFIILSLIAKYNKWSLRTYVIIFFSFLALSAVGISVLSSGILDRFGFNRVDLYVEKMNIWDYDTGFKVRFALYNTGFLLLAYILRKYLKPFGEFTFKFYVLSSALFFLWFAIPFSDRMGAFSWTVIPVIYYLPLYAKFKRMNMIPIAGFIVYAIVGFAISAAHYD